MAAAPPAHRLFTGAGIAAAQPSSGIQPGQGVTVPDRNLPTSMRSFNVLPRLFCLTSALIIHYHMQKKKNVKNFLIMHYVEQLFFTVQDVSIIMRAPPCDLI